MKYCRDRVKVLFVSHSSAMYGAERSLLLLLKNIDRKYIEPIVALPEPGPLEEEITKLNIKVWEVRSPWWVRDKVDVRSTIRCVISEVKALWKLISTLRREKVDLVYTNTIVKFTGALAAAINRKPHIWHIREILQGNPGLHSLLPHKVLFKLIVSLSNKVITNSNATGRQFQCLDHHNKVQVVYNAVDSEAFAVPSSFPGIEGAAQGDWLVAVVAPIQENKAQDVAIRAVEIARKAIPNIKLLLIGEADGVYLEYLRRTASELNVLDEVVFAGYRDDVAKVLPYCKVLLSPSLVESFGRTIMEAMAAGIPVIGADTGGRKEIIKDGSTGYLVPANDHSEMARKIIELFRHPDKVTMMGERGREVAAEKFTVERYAQDITRVITEVMQMSCGGQIAAYQDQ
ncbi:MAG: glycosyltransferase family 4 protein [Planctomycetota bacterium]|nr:MAG: glycosyltransferase family 4 protein [Planctomycetota bacterium]